MSVEHPKHAPKQPGENQRSYRLISRVFAGLAAELTRNDILDNITLTWLTGTALSSTRLYWESKVGFLNVKGVTIPVAVSVFPDELHRGGTDRGKRFGVVPGTGAEAGNRAYRAHAPQSRPLRTRGHPDRCRLWPRSSVLQALSNPRDMSSVYHPQPGLLPRGRQGWTLRSMGGERGSVLRQ